jgi:hypothetical protein
VKRQASVDTGFDDLSVDTGFININTQIIKAGSSRAHKSQDGVG